MPSLLLIEPHWEGHNMRYVAWISAEASRLGYDIRLATSKSFFDHPLFEEIQAGCEKEIEGIELPNQQARPIQGRFGYKFHYHRMFSKLYESLEKRNELPDYIIVPYLDYITHAAALVGSPFGSVPWGGIYINPHFHLEKMGVKAPRSAVSRIKETLFFRLLGVETLASVLTFDELLLRYSREKSPALASKVRFLPEPVSLGGGTSREEARKKLSIRPSEKVILAYGVMDESKNLATLLQSLPRDASLLVAGTQDEPTKTLLASPRANGLRSAGLLHERDAFLHGAHEHDVFLASDVVWVGYKGQYISSGVLLQAGMASLPVVACDEGVIGWLTKNHGLGLTVNPDDPDEISAALSKLTGDSHLARRLGANGHAHSQNHTTERFTQTLGRELPRSFPIPSN